MDEVRIPPAGDPFTVKAPESADHDRLARLEERLGHELMDVEERCELRDRVLRLRRRLGL